MSTTKQQKIRIGLFAVVTGALLAIVLVVFAGLHFWTARTRYYVEFDSSVYGLEKGADVFMNGMRVGKVHDIGPSKYDLRRVRVALAVREDAPVRINTKAVLQFAGITGLKVIDLRDGTYDSHPMPAGGRISVGETILDKIEAKGMAMVDQSEQLLESANSLIAKTERIVDNLADVTDPQQMGDIMAQTRTVAGNLAQASAGLRGLIDENRAGLKASVAAIEATARRTADLVDGNQVKAAVADLRQASRSFKELAREVRQRPSRLLYSQPAPDRKLP
jgi:phospholipid/cholesterol/gamma-HCH transport system substrate-binding protein